MSDVRIVEDGDIAGTKRGADGYLYADIRAARTGVQDYAGFELGHPDRERIRVYRPPEEVFHRDSMRSYAGRPVTVMHPRELVNKDNWKEFAVGQLGQDITRDGERVSVGVMLMDGAAIAAVEGGTREVSMGYTSRLDMLDAPETTPDGEQYDAVMRDLRMNHLAIVPRGRAGPEFRIGDEAWGASPITKDGISPSVTPDGNSPSTTTTEDQGMSLKTIVVDGLTVETTDAAEKAIVKLQGQLTAAVDAATTAATDHAAEVERIKGEHATAIADKDKAIGAKDSEIEGLKKEVVTGAALDALVTARSTLIGKASALAKDAKFDGKSDAEIRAIAVDAIHGEGFTKDKSTAWVEGAFDSAKVPEGTGDPIRDALVTRAPVVDTDDNKQAAYEGRITDAWKGTTGEAA